MVSPRIALRGDCSAPDRMRSGHNPVPRTASDHPPRLSYLIKKQQIQL